MIRNHAEAIVGDDKNLKNISNLVGHNFRFGEIEAALGLVQLKKLKKLILRRQYIANYLTKKLKSTIGLNSQIFKNSTHSFYIYPIVLNTKKIKISRNSLINKIKKSGLNGIHRGYIPANLLPIFQKKVAFEIKIFLGL